MIVVHDRAAVRLLRDPALRHLEVTVETMKLLMMYSIFQIY